MTQTPPHQPKLHYEDFNDALHDLVQALGGFKKVGPRLWQALPQEDAAQKLRHCLNRDRREKLDPDELRTLLRWAREMGFHGAKHFLDEDTGYSRSSPIDPKDEMAELQRRYIESVDLSRAVAERMERLLTRGPLALVEVKKSAA